MGRHDATGISEVDHRKIRKYLAQRAIGAWSKKANNQKRFSPLLPRKIILTTFSLTLKNPS